MRNAPAPRQRDSGATARRWVTDDCQKDTTNLHRAALHYASSYGWHVLPLHSACGGGCTCGSPTCKNPGIHPRTPHGVKDATTDAAIIDAWWRRWPDANIGIATGQVSGVAVLDVDDLEALKDLEAEHGPLPETVTATTGRGIHAYFRCPPGGLRSRVVPPGVELRADGSYVVAPPSQHWSGRQYAWEVAPNEAELADLPDWLLEGPDEPERARLGPVPERILAGARNETLTRYAGALRRYGLDEEEIAATLLAINARRCEPPLEEREVRAIARSIGRYESAVDLVTATSDAPPPLREYDATELIVQEIPPLPPNLPLLGQDGYILEGWSHLLAGYPKAGKTELLYAFVRGWVRAGHTVLYITEESERVWQYRLARDPALPRGLTLVFALGEQPDQLLERAAFGSEEIVVVDTIRSLLGIADESDNAEIARVVGEWEAALRGKTRIYVHHLRKSLGDHGLAVAGGTMLVGAVDRVLELRHDELDANRRVLRVISRIVGAPDLLLGLDSDGWPIVLGDPATVELERVMAACLDVLESENWLKTSEVRDRLPEPRPSHNQLLKALRELWQQGVIERDPAEDRQRATHRWRLLPTAHPDLHFTHRKTSRVKEDRASLPQTSLHTVGV
jgi:hypothetical protein